MSAYRTKRSIMIDSRHDPKNALELFERIFYLKPETAELALQLYKRLMNPKIKANGKKELLMEMKEDLGITDGQFNFIVQSLQGIGLLKKSYAEYRPSRIFEKRLDALQEQALLLRNEVK